MTSSVHDLSEGSGPNEQQKQSQPEIQSQSPANGNIQPGMATRAAEYVMPRHLDMAHTMEGKADDHGVKYRRMTQTTSSDRKIQPSPHLRR